MRQYPFPNQRRYRAAFGLYLFVMLLLARDTLVSSLRLGFYRSQFLMLGCIGALGLIFLIWNRKSLRSILLDCRMLAMGVSCLIFLVPMLCKRDWQIMYFSMLLCVLFPIFLTYFTDVSRVAKYYVVILSVLAVSSLLATYLFREIVWAKDIALPILTNDAGMEFYDFGLSYAVTNPYWNRNFGIFREPGVYQFFLILGLYLNNYPVHWEKAWKCWLVNLLLAVTVVTTFSVVGLLELALFALFLYIDKKYYRTKLGRILGIGVCVTLAGMIGWILLEIRKQAFGDTILFEFYDIFVRLTTDSESLMDRLSAIFTDIRLFIQHPLLGERIAPVLHGTNHNTSSTLILYATLGFFGGTLNLAAWVALVWKKHRNLLGNLILLGIFLMSFNTQNLVADVFFWLFPCMALAERGLPLLKLPKKEAGNNG